MKVTLLVPTLNEIDGMKAVMPRIDRSCLDQVLVVDGGSTDGTKEYARRQGYDLWEQKSRGLAAAYREALPHASGDIVVTFTPDGNSLPERIPALVAKMREGYDMVIVSRYREGARSYDDDPVTAFGNWMFTTMINVLFRGKYTDTLVGFRAWRKDLYYRIEADKRSLDFEPYSAVMSAKMKLRVAEIPGDEPKRIGGTRKMHPIRNGIQVLRVILREVFSGTP